MGLKNKFKKKGQHRKGGRSSTGKEGDQVSPLVIEAKNGAKLKLHFRHQFCLFYTKGKGDRAVRILNR